MGKRYNVCEHLYVVSMYLPIQFFDLCGIDFFYLNLQGPRAYALRSEFRETDNATAAFIAEKLETKGLVGIIVDADPDFCNIKNVSECGSFIVAKFRKKN